MVDIMRKINLIFLGAKIGDTGNALFQRLGGELHNIGSLPTVFSGLQVNMEYKLNCPILNKMD